MYNKTHCSTAKNSSFLKCFLVRLRCKRKPVEKWSWQRFLLFQPLKNQLASTCVHVTSVPWPRLLIPAPPRRPPRCFFYQPSDLGAFPGRQLDSSGQPGAHTRMVRERLSVWTIKKIPSVQRGALLGMKRQARQSRPMGAGGEEKKDKMDAAASRKP